MGYIRDPLKPGGRYQAEVRLKGHPKLSATFDRKTDAKAWIQKVEADIRCGLHQLYSEAKRHTFGEAVERYCKEQAISIAKRGHLNWWHKELGALYFWIIGWGQRPNGFRDEKYPFLIMPIE